VTLDVAEIVPPSRGMVYKDTCRCQLDQNRSCHDWSANGYYAKKALLKYPREDEDVSHTSW